MLYSRNILNRRKIPGYPIEVIKVILPPTKQDCTCVTSTNKLSLMNAPTRYCLTCNNKGFIETQKEFVIEEAQIIDFASDTNPYSSRLEQGGGFDYNTQLYVLHASLENCYLQSGSTQTCFDIAKRVIDSDNVKYKILSYDKTKLLGQIRVIIEKVND